MTDLAKWEAALQKGTMLKLDVVKQMETPMKLTGGGEAPYGLGNELGRDHGHRFAGHQGGGMAFNTALLRFPDDRLSVIVLTNLTQAPALPIARKIAALYLPDLSDEGKPAIRDDAPEITKVLKQVLLDAAQGKVDATRFTAQAAQEIVPRLPRIGPRFLGPLGALHAFLLIEHRVEPSKEGGNTLRRYRAVYERGNMVWAFTLDAHGKIATMDPTQE